MKKMSLTILLFLSQIVFISAGASEFEVKTLKLTPIDRVGKGFEYKLVLGRDVDLYSLKLRASSEKGKWLQDKPGFLRVFEVTLNPLEGAPQFLLRKGERARDLLNLNNPVVSAGYAHRVNPFEEVDFNFDGTSIYGGSEVLIRVEAWQHSDFKLHVELSGYNIWVSEINVHPSVTIAKKEGGVVNNEPRVETKNICTCTGGEPYAGHHYNPVKLIQSIPGRNGKPGEDNTIDWGRIGEGDDGPNKAAVCKKLKTENKAKCTTTTRIRRKSAGHSNRRSGGFALPFGRDLP